MRLAITFVAFLSVIFFPWPLTACLALGMSLFEPIVAFAIGLFADTLYYTPHETALPFFTLSGAAVTIAIVFVRSRLKASIIEG